MKTVLTSQRSPLILEKMTQEAALELQLQIPEDLSYFEGHFAEMPVVPGVVQLHWVVEFSKDFLALDININKGAQIKFMNLMQPNDLLTLSISIEKEKQLISYKYHSEKCTYSSGKLSYDY